MPVLNNQGVTQMKIATTIAITIAAIGLTACAPQEAPKPVAKTPVSFSCVPFMAGAKIQNQFGEVVVDKTASTEGQTEFNNKYTFILTYLDNDNVTITSPAYGTFRAPLKERTATDEFYMSATGKNEKGNDIAMSIGSKTVNSSRSQEFVAFMTFVDRPQSGAQASLAYAAECKKI